MLDSEKEWSSALIALPSAHISSLASANTQKLTLSSSVLTKTSEEAKPVES